jgi:O-acetyl-ADP-ribose deacetylase (regulator of RNase III)
LKTIKGDLISLAKNGQFDVIVHGCNCFCTMGKGIALSVKNSFPQAYMADRETGYGDKAKLGTLSKVCVKSGIHEVTIVNAYTQYDYRGPQKNVDYDAIRSAFKAIKLSFTGLRIGYPQVGAGLARGDWAAIEAIIADELHGEDHTLVMYEPSAQVSI